MAVNDMHKPQLTCSKMSHLLRSQYCRSYAEPLHDSHRGHGSNLIHTNMRFRCIMHRLVSTVSNGSCLCRPGPVTRAGRKEIKQA